MQLNAKRAPLLLFFISIIYISGLRAQTIEVNHVLLDSLNHLGYKMYNETNEPERLQANYIFIKTLVQYLKSPHSIDDTNLDTLKMIAIRREPKNNFRIFSWHIRLNDGSYRYYGAIQWRTKDGSLSLKALVDRSPLIDKPEEASLDNNNWYGAQYYDIIPMKGLPQHYLLLGWRGTTPKVTQKVIDVLHLTESSVAFGKKIFKDPAFATASRLIYSYNARATMLMKYEKDKDRIVMDHLAPATPSLKGQFEHYGPDMSYDAWKIKTDYLILEEDLPLKNEN
ncbi:hypothetical protein [Olivibacter jilunii]|uniref:hypothetical protein n=1 Tax=Olivibacter jilunii TaxID=985016 RepID=UPI001031B87E|nr:hypothetical protein [Olivibacter jilunii]